jgi:hypothetical protein
VHGIFAEGVNTVRLGHIHADAGLEPLPVPVDQADHRNRGIEQAGGEPRDFVAFRVGTRIEQPVASQHLQAPLLETIVSRDPDGRFDNEGVALATQAGRRGWWQLAIGVRIA